MKRMDNRGIPIVVPGTPRRTPNTPTRNDHHTSPFIINSLKNEKSLLDVYDSFADACFQSHFNHSMINEDYRYNIQSFYKTEICPSDNIPYSATLPPSPKPLTRTNSAMTFETDVPEDMDFEDIRSESNMLESFSTSHSQLAANHQRGLTPEEVLSVDAQLEEVTELEITPMEVDNVQLDSDIVMTTSHTTSTDQIEVADTTKLEDSVLIDTQPIDTKPQQKNTSIDNSTTNIKDIHQVKKPKAASSNDIAPQINESMDDTKMNMREELSIPNFEPQQIENPNRSAHTAEGTEFRSVTATVPSKELFNDTNTDMTEETVKPDIPKQEHEKDTSKKFTAASRPTRNHRIIAATTTATVSPMKKASSSSKHLIEQCPSSRSKNDTRRKNMSRELNPVALALAKSPKRVIRSQALDQSPTTRSGLSRGRNNNIDSVLIEGLVEKKMPSRNRSKKGKEAEADRDESAEVNKGIAATIEVEKEEDAATEFTNVEAFTMEVDKKENRVTEVEREEDVVIQVLRSEENAAEIGKEEIFTVETDKNELRTIEGEKKEVAPDAKAVIAAKIDEETANIADTKKEEVVMEDKNEEFKEEGETPKMRKEQRMERDKKEIDQINKAFPTLSRYYKFVERAGRGTFSKVYKAKDLLVDQYMPLDQRDKLECALGGTDSSYVAVKVIFDISSPRRVAHEITCLSKFRSSPCITPLITAFRHEAYTYVVLPYIEYDHFDDFFLDMTLSDVRSYISQLLTGLKYVHKENIMHRDVKPGNFLYNSKRKVGYLADFGLAQYVNFNSRLDTPVQHSSNNQYTQVQEKAGRYIHDTRPHLLANRSGTKGFRAPEVLLRHKYQTTAIDIWAVGVILLIILSGRYPFFEPEDDADGVMELAYLFGMKKQKEFTEYYGRKISTNIPIQEEELNLAELCRNLNEENVQKWDNKEYLQAIDLLKNCLELIHTKRYTAVEALNHPFLRNIH